MQVSTRGSYVALLTGLCCALCLAALGCSDDQSGLVIEPVSQTAMDINDGAGRGATVVFTVANDLGRATGLLEAPALGGENPQNFEVVDDDCRGLTLKSGQSCTFGLRPVASGNGSYQAKLTISDSDVTSNIVQVSGTASGFSGASLVALNASGLSVSDGVSPGPATTVTVRNDGSAASDSLCVPSLSNPTNFEVLNDGCSGKTLAAGESCTFDVRLLADQDGTYTCTLTICAGGLEIALSGTASGFSLPATCGSFALTDQAICSEDGWCWENPLPQGGAVGAIWGNGSSDVYAVAGGGLLHFDGSTWKPVSLGPSTSIFDVWGSGADDIYAVGDKILHRDGADWQELSGTGVPTAGRAVFGTSAQSVWVGDAAGRVWYFDGTSWSSTDSTTSSIVSIWATGPDDVFVVALEETPGDEVATVFGHWDGSDWETKVLCVDCSEHAPNLWGFDSSNVFVTGPRDGQVFRWEGTQWHAYPIAADGFQVWGVSSTDVFLGHSLGYSAEDEGISRFDGTLSNPTATPTDFEAGFDERSEHVASLWGTEPEAMFAGGHNGSLAFYDGTQWCPMTPSRTASAAALVDVWASSSGEAFAVSSGRTAAASSTGIDTSSSPTPLARRSGDAWQPVVDQVPVAGLAAVLSGAADDIYVVGGTRRAANLLHYDGTRWQAQQSGTQEPLNAIAACGPDLFAVGHGGAVVRKQGTSAWTAMNSGTIQHLNSLWCADEKAVFAVGDGGTAIRYDEGSGWSPMTSGTSEALMGVWGSSPTKVFAVGSAGAILEYDGTDWRETFDAPGALGAVWGSSGGNAFAVGDDAIYRYQGAGWSLVDTSGLTLGKLGGIWGSAADDVYAVSDEGIFQFDGTSWSDVSALRLSLAAISGTSSDNVVAVGPGRTIIRYDGTGWRYLASEVGLHAIWGSDPADVWAVGSQGRMLRYDGTVWRIEAAGDAEWRDLEGFASNDVYALGGAGMARYDGTSWTPNVGGAIPDTMHAIWGSAPTNIYAVGEKTDGTDRVGVVRFDGANWNPLDLPHKGVLTDVWGSGPDNIFAVGSADTTSGPAKGLVLRFDGTTWSPMDLPAVGPLDAVWGSGADDVYAVGSDGAILRYQGGSWAAEKSGAQKRLHGVFGLAADDVVAVGAQGMVLRLTGQ